MLRRPSLSSLAALLILGLGVVACGDVTGLEDPSELELGTFRAEVTGARNTSLVGDTHNYWANDVETKNLVWYVRLNSPPGPGTDSVRIDFVVDREVERLPDVGTYPLGPYSLEGPVESDTVGAYIDFLSKDSTVTLFQAQTGSLTITEAVDSEVVAGRFEFVAESGPGDTISVRGAFRSRARAP